MENYDLFTKLEVSWLWSYSTEFALQFFLVWARIMGSLAEIKNSW